MDISSYQLPQVRTLQMPNTAPAKVQERFIAPMPLVWAQQAARLKGKSFHVAAILWHRHKLTKSNPVTVPKAVLGGFGVSRQCYYKALDALESADMVETTRSKGCSTRVTIKL